MDHVGHDGVDEGEALDGALISVLAGRDLGLDVEQALLDDSEESPGTVKGVRVNFFNMANESNFFF